MADPLSSIIRQIRNWEFASPQERQQYQQKPPAPPPPPPEDYATQLHRSVGEGLASIGVDPSILGPSPRAPQPQPQAAAPGPNDYRLPALDAPGWHPPQPKQDDGGFLGSLGGALSHIAHGPADILADVRDTGADVLNRRNPLGDAFDTASNAFNVPNQLQHVGQAAGEGAFGPSLGAMVTDSGHLDLTSPGRWLDAVTKGPLFPGSSAPSDIVSGQGNQQYQRFAQSDAPAGLKAGTNMAVNPVNWLAGPKEGLGMALATGAEAQLGQGAPEWAQGPLQLGAGIAGATLAHNPELALKPLQAGVRGVSRAGEELTTGALAGERGSFDPAQVELPTGSPQSAYMRAKNAAFGGALQGAEEPNITATGPLANTVAPDVGLGLGDRASNAVRAALNKPAKYHPVVTPIMENGEALAETLHSQANVAAEEAKATQALFKVDKQGRWLLTDESKMTPADLAQMVAQDPARAASLVTDEQRVALARDMANHDALRQQAAQMGVEIPEADGYLPRGTPTKGGIIDRIRSSGGRGVSGGKVGAEKGRVYETQEAGIANGEQYPSYPQAVADTMHSLANRVAAAHTAEMLKPLGTTAGERIPDAVRTEYEAATSLTQRLAGRLDTAEGRAGQANASADELARGLEKQATGAALSPEQMGTNLLTVNRFIDRAQQRITQLRQQGGAFATEAKNYQDMLDDARLRLDDATTQWKEAKVTANATPRGHGPINLAPLQGHAFPNEIANAANSALEPGAPLAGKLFTTPSSFLNSTRTLMDFATVARLAKGAALAPGAALRSIPTAVKSFARPGALGDVITEINARAESGLGPSVEELVRDYGIKVTPSQQQGMFTKVPGIAQASRFIGTYSNALRLRAAHDLAPVYEAAGLLDSPGAKLDFGRGLNLATGEGKPLFGPAGYGLVNFPKWLGSQLQFIHAGATEGTITGAMAREAYAKVLGMGTVTAYVANAAQGKETKWQDGVPIMWIGDTKVNPYGGDGTLIKLAGKLSPVSLDAEHNLQRPDLAYAAQSKGSPVVSILADLATGQSFNGVTPSLTNPEYLARSIAPYTIANTGKESPLTQGLSATGIRASDMTPRQQLDDIAQQRFGKGFADLSTSDQTALKADHPGLTQEWLDSQSQQTKDYNSRRDTLTQQQSADDAALLAGSITPAQWKAAIDDRRNQLKGVGSVEYGDKPITDPKTWAQRYSQVLQQNTDTKTGRTNFDQVNADIASLSPEDQANIADKRGIGTTSLVTLRKQISAEYNALPIYRGYTPQQGHAIDQLVIDARALAKGGRTQAPSDVQVLQALRKVAQQQNIDLTSPAYTAARRSVLGIIQQDPARATYRARHPEEALLSGNAVLTPLQLAAIKKRMGAVQ